MRVPARLFLFLILAWLIGCVPQVDKNSNTPSTLNANSQSNSAQPVPTKKPTPTQNSDPFSVGAPLIIPVAGVRREDLRDTFTERRGEGRTHDAIDIIAPRGTNVLAAADGEIAQFHDSVPGGITIYQYSADKTLIYYYAHLERRAEDLKVGDFVRRGTVIGYVGDTGNAGTGNYHLHFAIWTITDPKRIWKGANINPYPLLTRAK
jgi:murein DD-endopeptidase MepM/ murein hydrolase activator NlpD